MNDPIIKTFSETTFRLFQKIAYQILVMPIMFFSQYAMILSILAKINKYGFGFEIILGICIFLSLFYGEYIGFLVIRDLLVSAAIIDLYSDKFIGHTHFKKNIWEIEYNKIKSIRIAGSAKLSFLFEDVNGKKYEMSFMMVNLQECMEYIVAKSSNIKTVDFGKRPKSIYWTKSEDSII